MPIMLPTGGAVDWPADEGILGVVGVAPWATIEFCKLFYEKIKANKDWHYPRVLLDINTKLPSRGRYLQLGETDPSPFIAETIHELVESGATVVVVPCNTAHLLYDRWAMRAAVPVPHIVRETVSLVRNAGFRCVTPFTSSSLAEWDLYGNVIEGYGLRCERLNESDQALVSHMIEAVKKTGTIPKKALLEFDRVLGKLKARGVRAGILGCTELSLLGDRLYHNGMATFDSNVALAEAALRVLNLSPERRYIDKCCHQ